MSFWSAVVCIAVIGGIVSVLRARYNAQHGITEDMMGNQTLNERAPEKDPEAERELRELRERVKVLERIAIDGRGARELSDEIEQLRKD